MVQTQYNTTPTPLALSVDDATVGSVTRAVNNKGYQNFVFCDANGNVLSEDQTISAECESRSRLVMIQSLNEPTPKRVFVCANEPWSSVIKRVWSEAALFPLSGHSLDTPVDTSRPLHYLTTGPVAFEWTIESVKFAGRIAKPQDLPQVLAFEYTKRFKRQLRKEDFRMCTDGTLHEGKLVLYTIPITMVDVEGRRVRTVCNEEKYGDILSRLYNDKEERRIVGHLHNETINQPPTSPHLTMTVVIPRRHLHIHTDHADLSIVVPKRVKVKMADGKTQSGPITVQMVEWWAWLKQQMIIPVCYGDYTMPLDTRLDTIDDINSAVDTVSIGNEDGAHQLTLKVCKKASIEDLKHQLLISTSKSVNTMGRVSVLVSGSEKGWFTSGSSWQDEGQLEMRTWWRRFTNGDSSWFGDGNTVGMRVDQMRTLPESQSVVEIEEDYESEVEEEGPEGVLTLDTTSLVVDTKPTPPQQPQQETPKPKQVEKSTPIKKQPLPDDFTIAPASLLTGAIKSKEETQVVDEIEPEATAESIGEPNDLNTEPEIELEPTVQKPKRRKPRKNPKLPKVTDNEVVQPNTQRWNTNFAIPTAIALVAAGVGGAIYMQQKSKKEQDDLEAIIPDDAIDDE